MKTVVKFGLLYNIILTEDTVRHHEEFRNIFCRKFCVCNNGVGLILPDELFSLTPSSVNCPCQMPSDEFKIHLRTVLLTKMKSCFTFQIFAKYSSLIFVKVQQSVMYSALHRLWEISFNFVKTFRAFLLVDFSCENLV